MAKRELVKVLDSEGTIELHSKKYRLKHVFKDELVEVELLKQKNRMEPKLCRVKEASKHRVPVECSIYDYCGGCSALHIDYAHQLALKKRELIGLLLRNLNININDVHGMPTPFAYRNKAIISFQRNNKGEVVAGLYEEDSHRVVSYDTCLLHDEMMDPIVKTILRLARKYRVEIYDEKKNKGMLRHVLFRTGKVSGECMVVIVTKKKIFPGQKKFVQELTKQHPYITTIVQNVNPRQTSIVLGDEEKVWYGPGFIFDTLCGLKFRISAKSFYQINHEQCTYLYEKALSLIPFTGNETLLDTYCGIGTIGMVASSKVKQVIGVELNKDAVSDAKKNAQMNKINNINFIAKDASQYMMEAAINEMSVDVVIMDPPRSGSDDKFIKAVERLQPKYVLYISCNPETQIRDLISFKSCGYETDEMYPVDMFPNTKHIESICLLKRI